MLLNEGYLWARTFEEPQKDDRNGIQIIGTGALHLEL